ncbi:patched domain-containing protein 1-like [Mercenaria mercenaria]|uniref:patched domain-containing protein 1-like n=1 Tax=Mercenaria mercenaria TaxID=6596 RepID=UPI001E1DCC73|nr:patched domain-containing protein 1-like [Mercenaria mercenaria]
MSRSAEKEARKRAKKEKKRQLKQQRVNFQEAFKHFFEVLAICIAKHPWKVAIITFLFNGLLGLGMLNLPASKLLNNDIEDLYIPKGGPTEKTANELLKLFPDKSGYDFYPHQNVKQPMFAEIMIWKHDVQNLINGSIYQEIEHIMKFVKNISTFTVDGGYAKYPDLCARRNGECVIQGEEVVEQIKDNDAGTIPIRELLNRDGNNYESSLTNLADYTVENDTLTSAKYLKVRFHLRQDSETMLKNSKLWRDHFVTYMKKFIRKQYPDNLHLTFTHSGAFYEELGNDTFMDIPYFSFVFTVFLTYLGIIMAGGNIISKRVNIGRIGIVVTPVSVLGAWGLLMGCGVEFTNTIGVIPLLIQAHQIINAMIALSHLSDVNDVKDAHKRVAYAVKTSAIPVTLTTLCHVIPFAVGIPSNYYVTKLVCIYFVVTMLFNYFNHFVFFTACLALHEHRIDAELHFCCWTKLTPRDQLIEEGRNCCVICCCSGKRPETREDTESGPERLSRKLMSRFFLTTPMKFFSVLSYLAYLVFVIWGLTMYDIDSVQISKVLPKSYFSNWNKYWTREFKNESIIQFVAIHPYGYTHNQTIVSDFEKLIKTKSYMKFDSFQSWFETYSSSDYKNLTTEEAFLQSVQESFIPNNPVFKHDLVSDAIRPRVIASRFYMKTKHVSSTKAMIQIKKDLQKLVKDINEYAEDIHDNNEDNGVYESPFIWQVDDDKYFIVHSPDFLATDWYMLPLWEILKIAAVQFGLLFCLSLILNPSLGMAIQLPFCYFSMVGGIFGLSHFFGVYLTPVPMIVYMIGCSYSTEVISHTYYHFMKAEGINRAARMNTVLSTISQAIFHTIFGQFLGLLVLIVDESYVFVTVFQLTIITTGSCVIHTVLWLPTLLSLLGPGEEKIPEESLDIYKVELATISNGTASRNNSAGIANRSFVRDS